MVIVAVVVVVCLGAGYWYLNQPEQRGCTMEAKLCPDGSAVGRSGPNCEFAPCPEGLGTNEPVPPDTETPGCVLENCHGLDIQCGAKAPEMCTAMYGLGDKCLQYAECGIVNGNCQQIENAQFTRCKTCVQDCIVASPNDPIKTFQCESECS